LPPAPVRFGSRPLQRTLWCVFPKVDPASQPVPGVLAARPGGDGQLAGDQPRSDRFEAAVITDDDPRKVHRASFLAMRRSNWVHDSASLRSLPGLLAVLTPVVVG